MAERSANGRPALLALSIVLAMGTVARNREYRSGLSLAQLDVERYPTSFAHHVLASELIAAGRQEEAMRHLEEAIRGGAPRAYYTLGSELFKQKRWDEAIAALQAFVREQPLLLEAVSARALLGLAFAEQQRWPEAIVEYRAVLQMHPTAEQWAEAQSLLAKAHLRMGAYDEAIAEYQTYLRARPDDVNAMTNLAVALVGMERLTDAIPVLRRAMELDPQNGVTALNLANALYDHREFAAALGYAQSAVTLRPRDPGSLQLLGRSLTMVGQLPAAVTAFEEARRLDPQNAEIQADLAKVLRLRGRGAGTR